MNMTVTWIHAKRLSLGVEGLQFLGESRFAHGHMVRTDRKNSLQVKGDHGWLSTWHTSDTKPCQFSSLSPESLSLFFIKLLSSLHQAIVFGSRTLSLYSLLFIWKFFHKIAFDLQKYTSEVRKSYANLKIDAHRNERQQQLRWKFCISPGCNYYISYSSKILLSPEKGFNTVTSKWHLPDHQVTPKAYPIKCLHFRFRIIWFKLI